MYNLHLLMIYLLKTAYVVCPHQLSTTLPYTSSWTLSILYRLNCDLF